MIDTLKLLKPFIDNSLTKVSTEELAYMYQTNPETRILATAYNKIYKLAIDLQAKYWNIPGDDIASICLEKLDYCLKTYKEGNAFTTYFGTVFSNALRTYTEALNCQKRKCILEPISEIINLGVEDIYNLIDCILPYDLTDRERTLCFMTAEGWDRQSIAEELKVSRQTVHNIELSLRTKLIDLIN